MKVLNFGILSALVMTALLAGGRAYATPGDGYCEGEKDGKKYSILIGRHAAEGHPDDFEEVSIDGQPIIRFLESSFDHAMRNFGVEGKEFYLNTRIAKNEAGEIELVYPEQDPDGETWYVNLYLKVPSKSVAAEGVEMTCQN
jgi:hypothetical protein